MLGDQRPINIAVLSGVRHAGDYIPMLNESPHFAVTAIAEEASAPEWARDAGRELSSEYGLPFSTDVDGILNAADVECVLVCSEPVRHARLATMALRGGKHVLIDKPMATTPEDADRVVRAADDSSGRVTVINRLFAPGIQRARAAIDSGGIGLIRSADLEWLASDGLSGATVERPELVADPSLSGGGEMMNFLMYPLSALRYLTGVEFTEVYAETGSFFFEPHRSYGVEDIGILSLRLEYDIIASITVGRVPRAPSHGHGTSSIRLIGSHGHLVVDEETPELEIWNRTGRRARPIGGASGKTAVRRVLAEFAADIRSGRRSLFDVSDGYAVTAAVDAAYRSARSGQPEPVSH